MQVKPMLFLRTSLLVCFVFAVQLGFAQKKKTAKLSKSEKAIITNLQQHVSYLADDKLEGRRAGTNGEKLAMQYISEQFKLAGLEPKGSDGFYQPFDIYEGKQIGSQTKFVINGTELKQGTDYFPFAWTSNKSLEASPAISLQESNMPWFLDLADAFEENSSNPHFDVEEFIRTKAKEVKKKNATALIVYNTSSTADKLQFNARDRAEKSDIPVIYVTPAAAKKFFSDQSETLEIKLNAEVNEKFRKGHNVVGYINNNAATTVVLGAHFDHLGYGEDGNSMNRGGSPSIHNGADDNASGTAALIELAKLLKDPKARNSNYLFIAFSGEELGLNGSKYFVENPTIDLSKVNFMINMDMVGRLNDSTKVLTVGGIGTSPSWSQLIGKPSAFVIKVDSSGTGPSDHTSFYRKDIPVLFLFTGLHSDYHRPTDDANKINYEGELRIIQFAQSIINSSNSLSQKLAFTKTREAQTSTTARFSVSLGVMPDYTFAGSGVRIDGVSEGRAAQKAGMKAGDVIIQLGEHNVTSVENYMQALGKFKKGDATKVKFRRGNDVIEADVQF